jgi:hypothetical protein
MAHVLQSCVWACSKIGGMETTGTIEDVRKALKRRGQERLLHIIRVLSAGGCIPKLIPHFFGNYTLQNFLDATALLRHALAELQQVLTSPALGAEPVNYTLQSFD